MASSVLKEPSMFARYWLMIAAFHCLNVSALLFLTTLWKYRYANDRGIRILPLRIVFDLMFLGVVAVVSAAAIGLLAGARGFGIINLLSQWIFIELVIALALVARWFHRSGERRFMTLCGVAAAALVAIHADARFIEPRSLEIHEHVIEARSPSTPRAVMTKAGGNDSGPARELRIVHLSDIQTATIGAHERRAFSKAMELNPDLIVLTGDYLQSLPNDEDLTQAQEDFRTLLRAIRPPLGVYAIRGDVEAPDWRGLFEGTRVVTLENNSVRISLPGSNGRSLSLLGLSAFVARGGDGRSLKNLVASLPADDLKIVFGHSPDYVMRLDERSIDLALGGHTHGGQIAFPFIGAPLTLSRLPREMARGLHDWRGTPLHVSAGVGMEREYAPQLRFLCRPEVCLLRVRY
jgi:uncharacterized protein